MGTNKQTDIFSGPIQTDGNPSKLDGNWATRPVGGVPSVWMDNSVAAESQRERWLNVRVLCSVDNNSNYGVPLGMMDAKIGISLVK